MDLGVPGLVIVRTLTTMGHDCWTVTHVESGCGVGAGFEDPESAAQALTLLAPLGDWTLPGDQVLATVDKDAVWDITWACGGTVGYEPDCTYRKLKEAES